MRASKFTDAQKAFILKQADEGLPVAEIAPAIDARFSYRAEHVVATLQCVCAEIGTPKTIRVDQGSAPRSSAIGAMPDAGDLSWRRPYTRC